jgi:hypothetical protein
MAVSNTFQQRLASLAALTGTDPTDTSREGLEARGQLRRDLDEQEQDRQDWMPGSDPRMVAAHQRERIRQPLEVLSPWAPFHEAIIEAGERQNMPVKVAFGQMMDKRPSIQALLALRDRSRPSTQPEPWSLSGSAAPAKTVSDSALEGLKQAAEAGREELSRKERFRKQQPYASGMMAGYGLV